MLIHVHNWLDQTCSYDQLYSIVQLRTLLNCSVLPWQVLSTVFSACVRPAFVCFSCGVPSEIQLSIKSWLSQLVYTIVRDQPYRRTLYCWQAMKLLPGSVRTVPLCKLSYNSKETLNIVRVAGLWGLFPFSLNSDYLSHNVRWHFLHLTKRFLLCIVGGPRDIFMEP